MRLNMSQIKQVIAYFLIGLFFFSALKLLDIVVGMIVFDQTQHEQILTNQRALHLREFSPNQRVEIMPSDENMMSYQNLVRKTYTLTIDDNGFIVNGNDIDQFSDTLSIIFFGGSTTASVLSEERDRFPSVIERSLIDADGCNIKTLNGGVWGNNSVHSLLSYIGKGLSEKPSHVVLMHNINDLVLLSKTGSYWSAPRSRAIVRETNLRTSFVDILRETVYLLVPNIYKKVKPLFFPQGTVDEFSGYRDNNLVYSQIEQIFNKQFRASLESFVAVSRAWRIEPVLMTQFSRFNLNDSFIRETYDKSKHELALEDLVKLHQHGNEIIRSVATEHGVNLIDLVKEFPQTKDYIHDIVHLNKKGNLLVAKIITEHLIEDFGDTFKSK